MSEHDDLADQREREAADLEREGDLVDEHVQDAKAALKRTEDDAVIPTPLGDEDATAQTDAEAEGEANAVEEDGAAG